MNKPSFYAMLLPQLRDAARSQGYLLALHGGLITCLELVAMPWEVAAVQPHRLVEKLRKEVDGKILAESDTQAHGRKQWTIRLLPAYGEYTLTVSVLPPAEVVPAPRVATAAPVPIAAPVICPKHGVHPAEPAPSITLDDLTEGMELIFKRYPTMSRYVGKILRAYDPPRVLIVKYKQTTGRRLTLENLNKEFRRPYKERE